MIAGIDAYNPSFLFNLNNTQNQITKATQELSSGIRVSEASDDPTDIASILDYQNQALQIAQVQTNLSAANTEATAADTALNSAGTLVNQLTSIAAAGASGTTSSATLAQLSSEVQQIGQQMVNLANTTVNGQYIFGGDDPTTQPYVFDWSNNEGVSQTNTAGNTATIQDISGQTISPRMTAQQIFDAQNSDGTPASGNIFQAIYNLGQALQNDDQNGLQAATSALTAASTQLSVASSFYGNVEDWIQSASGTASSRLTTVETQVDELRNTDVAAEATELTTDQTALQAALAAHGTLQVRSLFDYLG